MTRGPVAARAALLIAAVLAGAGAQDSRPGAPRFVFVGLHGGVYDRLVPLAEGLKVRIGAIPDDVIATGAAGFEDADVVVIQHLRTEAKDRLKESFRAAWKAKPALRVLTIANAGADWFKPEDGVRGIERDPELSKYYQGSTVENLRRMLVYLLARYGGRDIPVEPVAPSIAIGLWHPDHEGFFDDAAAFAAWARGRNLDPDRRPRVAVTFHSLHLLFQQPAVAEALVRALEKRGMLAAVIIDTGEGLSNLREKYESLMLAFGPKLVIHTCHSPDTLAFREKLGVPHMHSVFFSRKSIDAWRASPTGLDLRDWVFQAVTQEVLGAIEPIVCAGTASGNGSDPLRPLPDRVERLAARAEKWVRLAAAPAGEKRAAFLYYDREMGKNELMRGSTTGMFMNGPRSLVNVLKRMAADGWRINSVPRDEDELLGWMLARGRQIGMWAPEELERLVREGDPVLVPVATYERWLDKRVPAARRAELETKWGKAPGEFMVWTDGSGAKFIVIPRIDLGNVVLLPQPLRGEAQDPKLLHDRGVPPPHNYLATYFWLDEGCHADVMVHFGTHGSEFLLPGKTIGTDGDDWGEILVGTLPNVNPWIVSNLGEAPPAKRRAQAVIVSHQTPPVVAGELADALLNLHEDVEKLLGLEPGALKEKFRKSVTEQARKEKLVADLHFEGADARDLTDDEVRSLDTYLHELRESKTPVSLHTLGEPPPDDLLVPYVTTCLRRKYLDALAAVLPPDAAAHEQSATSERSRKIAEEVVGLVVRRGFSAAEALAAVGARTDEGIPKPLGESLDLARDLAARFARAPEELDGLMNALNGRFVLPGPGASPVRNPASAPGGRNLYQVNPEELPSRPSFELAKKLVDQTIADHVKRHGRPPEKIACSLNAGASYADYGVMEGQIFWLLGVEPQWDEKNLVQDVRVVPRAELGRPRVDVFLASPGTYRDIMPTRMALIDKAIRTVAALDEPDNPVRAATARIEQVLVKRGIPADRARKLATARMFGSAPGGYGNAGYYYMIERSGTWESREDLVKAYLANVQYAYADGIAGELAPEAYEEAMRGTDVVMRNWSDPVRSPLSDKYMWFQGGSLALAVKHVTGREPEFRISDVRDPDASRTVLAEDALMADFRVKLFNRKWIEGMKKEGYAGADQVSAMIDNAFGWEIMREGSVRADVWDEIKKVFVDDKYGLRVREWFEAENPFAFQEVTEILLEAVRKGFWKADDATVRTIAEAYADSVRRHGEGNGLRGGGNEKLADFVRGRLGAPGKVEAAPGGSVPVSGPKLEPETRPAAAAPPRPISQPADALLADVSTGRLLYIGLFCLALFAIGFVFMRR